MQPSSLEIGMLSEHRFENQTACLSAVQAFVLAHIQQTLAKNANASLLLSGGNSPLPLYRALGEQALPWERLRLGLVDERWVPQSDPASNEAVIREALGAAASARLTGMYDGASLPSESVDAMNTRYALLPRPWSLGVMGLGADGHTASLFPASDGLEQALTTPNFCAPITAKPSPVTGPNIHRMTLSLSALMSIERLVLLFSGDPKWAVYSAARTTLDKQSLPIAYLLQQDAVPIDVFWSP